MGQFIDMTGATFGRLTAVSRRERAGDTRAYWLCRCECGAETVVSGKSLRSGSTKSCGCLATEWASRMGGTPDYIEKRSEKKVKHGHKRRGSPSPEYRTWLGMKRRCYDRKCKDYPNYGGRGIKVCDAWNASFEAFLSDMGPRPTLGHQIDRLSPIGDYEPDNCRWVTAKVQGGENRRDLLPLVIDGMRFPSIGAAARHFGVNLTTAHYRIQTGVPVHDAVRGAGRMAARRTRESYLPKTHTDRAD